MKEFLSNFKIPIILGSCAIAAIAVTLVLVKGGFSSDSGLYISNASGSVSVTNSGTVTSPANGEALKKGDIITIGENSSCTLVYKNKKNSEKNYLAAEANSQLVLLNDFDGKSDGDIFLRSGSVIGNFADSDKFGFNIRTADSMITAADSVSKISYSTNEFMSYTDLYTFMGKNSIQLYDAIGNPVNNAELQIEKKWGRVVSEDGPTFDALNLDFSLTELTAADLKILINIANIVGDTFPYSLEDLKAAYAAKSDDSELPPIEEPQPQPPQTLPEDSSDTIQTAEPIVTTEPAPTETTLPGQTRPRPAVTAASSSSPADAPNENTGGNSGTHYVSVIIDGEETIYEVPHGGSIERPADPVINGLTFIGWDGSFENITEDRTITALFKEYGDGQPAPSNPSEPVFGMHTVTVVIGDRSNSIQVEHGKSANLPATLNIDGYIFKGWDKDFTNITSDVTITAILEPLSHTVTFVYDGKTYTTEVAHGGTAVPPFELIQDSQGKPFSTWDKPLTNITADTTITAIFASATSHTVTFYIDGEIYPVVVEHGGTAKPPYQPAFDRSGAFFTGWSRSLENITEDVTIIANFTL